MGLLLTKLFCSLMFIAAGTYKYYGSRKRISKAFGLFFVVVGIIQAILLIFGK